ncbi:unnamed protein product, partial [Closterium sp. NIES-54]
MGVGDDAPLQQRYLGMVDGAGIVLWVMGQNLRMPAVSPPSQLYRSSFRGSGGGSGGSISRGRVGGGGADGSSTGGSSPNAHFCFTQCRTFNPSLLPRPAFPHSQLDRSSIEVRMAATAAAAGGGGLAGLAVAGLGAAALVVQHFVPFCTAHCLLFDPPTSSLYAPVKMAAAAGGGLAGLAFGGLGAAALGAPDVAMLAAMWAGSMAGGLLGATSAEAPGEGEAGGGVERLRVSAGGLDRLLQGNMFETAKVSDLEGSFRWRSFLPLSTSDSVLSLMLLLAMPHRPQVLPIVTYPSTSSSPFSSSPSSASPTASPEPAAAASSAGSGLAPVPSLSALVSQADVVNFLAECDGQPWFEWVAGRSLQDMGLPRMGAESTVKVEESDPVMEPFRLMLQHDIGGVPVVAPGTNRITANVSARDVLQLLTSPHLAEQHHLKPLTVADLVHDAQRPHHGAADVIWPIMVPPVTCRPSTPLREVIHAFRVARVHRIYVTREEEGGELLGVVTLRDAIRRFLVRQEEEEGETRGEKVEEPVPASTEVIHAFRVARVHRIYVTREPEEGVEGGELLGVLTLRDAIGRFLVRQEEGEMRGEKVEEPVPTSTEVGSDGLNLWSGGIGWSAAVWLTAGLAHCRFGSLPVWLTAGHDPRVP